MAVAAGGAASLARSQDPPAAFKNLRPMTSGIVPISDDERRARVDKAQRLMRDHKLGAILLEGGSSLYYFTGTRWTQSERTFVTIIPAKGDPVWIVPKPEEARAQQMIHMGKDMRTWSEEGGAYPLIAQALKDRGVTTGRVGIEERVRFAVFDGIRKEAPGLDFASADPVTAGCRVIKSQAEIALLQRANDVTIEAYRASIPLMREGMTQGDLRDTISAAYKALGFSGFAMTSFGKYTAFPHGSITPQKLQSGDLVLIDDGCSVEGYQSDITRTFIFGKPTARQTQVWNLERKAQDAALAAARPGAACESVDAAARKVLTDAGFGPGYKTPGLPHRTGHGIGLDGHEWTNLVNGNKTKIEPGMCFSNEPTIVIYGEFGIRLEDCMYVTPEGARMFTKQSPAIDQPFG
jgi:Xaa-Pro dipeptidase